MFEITPEDIAQLDDAPLRTLVGLLCEAELRRLGYSTAAVTFGGNQNAKDGGLDVRVSLPDGKAIDGYIPRPATGFQVKSQDMPPGAISGEMYPQGALRPVIAELAESAGAYIIVSSKGSVSDSALANRRKAMRAAASGLDNRLALDFYDRTRLASWVRGHAGLVLWVRRAIGRGIPGWEPFGAWAYPRGGTEAEYLIDKGVRVRMRSKTSDRDFPTEAGLKTIRDSLRTPKSVVRLVGLSGVGKTRFAQALFDGRIGEDALDPALAIYTNMSNDPDPQPFHLASDLIARGVRAILIVDNCAADLHARLAQLVRATTSSLSVLTIEYDIKDDQPEGTEVFEVEAASTELIQTLLRNRFPKLSQVDAQTAADFSGGNARMAIALSDTVGRGGSLSRLSEAQLFERLFEQRQGTDQSLLKMAEACALVYSFDGEDLSDGKDGELARIARMAGCTTEEAHRHVAELVRRDLAQKRGKWRAVLPHALSNRLAAAALENIPRSAVEECLINAAPERLTKSFARRLGYLDTSPEAKAIVHGWFAQEGWLGQHIWNLNEFGKELFRNCLPVDPEAGLRAFELGLPPHGPDNPIITGDYVARALRSLAWDAHLFGRCVALLELIAVDGEGKTGQDAAERHTSLFHLYISGTHASVKQRAAAIRSLLNSANPAARQLGLAGLKAILKANYFSSDYDFQFGGRSRDYGYHPQTWEEVDHWYKTTLELAAEFALSDAAAADGAKQAIAVRFRELWYSAAFRDALEKVVTKLAEKQFWREGWRAVKQTRLFDAKDKASENYARLTRLEVKLRPGNLVERVRGMVFMSDAGIADFDDVDIDKPDSFRIDMERKNEEAARLGAEVANDYKVFHELLPEIVAGRGNLFHLGRGLARGVRNPKELWSAMEEELARTPQGSRDTGAFCGMLWELCAGKSELPDEWLDHAIDHEPLASYFPSLQGSVFIDERGVDRLILSVKIGKAPIEAYRNIHPGSTIEIVPANKIANYVRIVAQAPGGESVAIHMLAMQFADDRQHKRAHASEVVRAGQDLLRNISFDRESRKEDYFLHPVIETCLAGGEGAPVAKGICANFLSAVKEHKTYGFEHVELLNALLTIQPEATMDALFGEDEEAREGGKHLMEQARQSRANPMDVLSEATLFGWCEEDPVVRFPLAASVATIFTVSPDQNPTGWAPLAVRLVHSAPDPVSVMREMVERLRPMTWSGSRSTILEMGVGVLDQFETRGNSALTMFIAVQKEELQREASANLDWETNLHKNRDERFE